MEGAMVMTITEMRELKEQKGYTLEEIAEKPGIDIELGAYQVKKQGEYTLEDYYALPDDQRYELIDGVLYDMAAPAVTHQEIVFEIEDVKNQKVIVYDLGDDFGENMLYY